MQIFDLKAYHFSKRVSLKGINVNERMTVLHHNPFEYIAEVGVRKYIFIYNYGSVVFFNLSPAEQESFLQLITKTLDLNITQAKYDDYLVDINPQLTEHHKIEFNRVTLAQFAFESIRIVALLIGESVALDYYQSLSDGLLAETKEISEELRIKGESKKNIKKLIQYMGQCLWTKQSLVTDLYIFDEPDETWDDQHLNRLHEDLRRNLELQSRFKSIIHDLNLIQESSEMVADLIQIRKQNLLEFTIIGLIAFEVLLFLFYK